jgi:hypothetical protein
MHGSFRQIHPNLTRLEAWTTHPSVISSAAEGLIVSRNRDSVIPSEARDLSLATSKDPSLRSG